MKKNKLILLISLLSATIVLLLVLIVFLLVSTGNPNTKDVVVQSDNTEAELSDTIDSLIIPEEIPEPIPEDKTIRLVAVGDNLFHAGVHLTGKQCQLVFDLLEYAQYNMTEEAAMLEPYNRYLSAFETVSTYSQTVSLYLQ